MPVRHLPAGPFLLDFTLLAWPLSSHAQAPIDLGTVTERHEMVPMRDGKRLSAYLYLPHGEGPGPWCLSSVMRTFPELPPGGPPPTLLEGLCRGSRQLSRHPICPKANASVFGPSAGPGTEQSGLPKADPTNPHEPTAKIVQASAKCLSAARRLQLHSFMFDSLANPAASSGPSRS
jgi:hypothetical protein